MATIQIYAKPSNLYRYRPLGEKFEQEPMWAHYADQFRGICVQYNTNALLKGLSDDVAITRMMYSEQEPVLLEDRSTPSERARVYLSSKTARWANEREWRLFRDGRGQVSYARQKALRKIFLGMRISPADQQRIVELGKQLHIPIVKMKVEAYSIQFSPIYIPPPKKKLSVT